MSRAERAAASHVPQSTVKKGIARSGEAQIARALGGNRLSQTDAFDILVGRNAIEVKTIVDGGDKITIHPDSRHRKISWAKSNRYQPWTVVVVARGGKLAYFYKEGVGSFRLTAMTRTG